MDVKEIKVTEEFLGLGEKETGCGVEEVKSDCVTRRYRDHLLASCGCAPFSLASHYGEEVHNFSVKDYISNHYEAEVCNSTQLDCVANLEVEPGECVEQCEGSIMEVERILDDRNEGDLREYLFHYEKFKNPDKSSLIYPKRMKGYP